MTAATPDSSRRWIAAIFLLVVTLALVAGWRIHAANTAQALDEYQVHQLHTVDVLAATLQAELNGTAGTLRTLADGLDGRAPHEMTRILVNALNCGNSPCFAALSVFDVNGRRIAFTGRRIGLDDSEVTAAIAWARTRANATHIRTVISAAKNPALVFVAPLVDPWPNGAGRLTGIVAGETEFDEIFAHQQQIGESNSSEFATLVLDPTGTVVFRSNHPEMRLRNVFNRTDACYSCHRSLAHVERMAAMKRGLLRYDVSGEPHLAAVAPFTFEGQSWVAAVSAPSEKAVVLLSSELRQIGVLVLGLVLALGFVGQAAWMDNRRRLEADAAAVNEAHLAKTNNELTALNARLESAAIEWRTTVDTIDAAVMVLDPDGSIERMNRAAADTLPGVAFSWRGQPAERLKDYPPWDAALKLAREAIDHDGTSTARVEYAVSGKTWDLWCRRPRWPDPRHSAVVVARDVTSVVELQESVARSETMAALGLVVVGVAHEVRNPLFTISSLVDAWSVQREGNPAPLIQALRREVFRLKTLMTDLLEYGKVRSTVLQRHPLDPLLAEAVAACNAEAATRRVTIDEPDTCGVDVWMDPRRLIRVFINVIQNAVQHAPEGTHVDVRVEKPSDPSIHRVFISVRDRGRGIAAEDLPKIFTPFFTRRAGGFGLGLAITERIVNEHRGRIAAENHPSGGARITIALPLTEPDAHATTIAQGGQQPC